MLRFARQGEPDILIARAQVIAAYPAILPDRATDVTRTVIVTTGLAGISFPASKSYVVTASLEEVESLLNS